MAQFEPLIIRVAVPSPLRRTFDYLIPENLGLTLTESSVQPGCRVMVPFGKREVTGLIIELGNNSEFALEKLKPVSQLIDARPLLPEPLFKLFIWAANYYQHPIGDALFSTLPVLLRTGALPPPQGQHCWQLTTHGKGLGADSLKQARRQRALVELLQDQGPAVAEDLILQTFSRAIVKQL
jgi:primosomal protein N' (replication factor Y)